MDNYRKEVIELIDLALRCESLLGFCGCTVFRGELLVCGGCQIKRALRVARSSIIKSVVEVGLLNVRLIGVQDAVESLLKKSLRPGSNGGKGGGPNE